MIYDIKRGNTLVWRGKPQGKQYKRIMQEDRVDIKVNSPSPVFLQRGDTIVVYGQTYKLNRPQNISRVNTQIGYSYQVEFEALYYDLGKWTLYTLDKNNELKEPEVYLMGDATAILGLMVQNANRASSGWTLGQIDDTDVLQWNYSSAKLLTVLQDAADRTGLEFWVEGKEINLTKREPETGIALEFGKGKGLYEINRQRKDKPVVTHLTVLGGTQNIPNGYGFRSIQPTGGNPLVSPFYLPGSERVEDTITFGNIYPRLIANVTATSSPNVIRSTDIDFNLNDHLLDDGTSAQIAFTSGLLNGFKFTIQENGYDHATKQITFNLIQDDKAYPDGVPNTLLKPVIGDSFVLLNIDMPASYVTNAENRLLELGEGAVEEMGAEQYDWSVRVTPKFILENDIEFTLGGLVTLNAADIGFNSKIRIASFERDIQEDYQYSFNLDNVVTINSLIREKNATDLLANTINRGIGSDGLSTKATYAEKAGYAEQAGHAATATNAATANFASQAQNAFNADKAILADRALRADLAERALRADYADDSDKWDGRQFDDYLNQPVRTGDSPTWQGVTAINKLLIPTITNAATNALSKSGSYLMMGATKAWAGRADLWNGLAQPDYVTQPVRPADSPKFTGISSPSFASGFAGNGFRIALDTNGDYQIEADRMLIRKDFSVYELIVNQIRATNGSLWVSDAIKITSATVSGSNFICAIDTDGGTIFTPFAVNDIIRCQKFNGRDMKYYTARVVSVSTDTFVITKMEGASNPALGDELVRIGNTTNALRQGALYLTASDSGAPFLDVVDGINTASFAGKTKVRLGKLDGIVDADLGALSGYGLYGQNVYVKGKLIAQIGSNVYNKTEADGKVTTAKNEAVSTAANDATTKANAAKDNAIVTANQFTQQAINGLEIGGRNLLLDSEIEIVTPRFYEIKTRLILHERVGDEIMLSFEIRGADGQVVEVYPYQNSGISVDRAYNVSVTSQYVRHTLKFVVKDWGQISGFTSGSIAFYDRQNTGPYRLRRRKIEFGNKATDWTPAPEDFNNALEVFRTETNTQFTVQNGLIASKVSQTDFNALGQRVGNAETSITQNSTDISQRATKTEVTQQVTTARNGAVADAKTYTDGKVTALNADITGITTRVTQAETAIDQNATAISLRATKVEVTTEVTTAVNNIKLGGENLIPNSGDFKDTSGYNNFTLETLDGVNILSSSTTVESRLSNAVELKGDTEYVFSGEVMFASAVNGTDVIPLHAWIRLNNGSNSSGYASFTSDIKGGVIPANKWVTVKSRIKTVPTPNTTDKIWFTPILYITSGSTIKRSLKWWQIKEGNQPTPWTPNPYDAVDRLIIGSTNTYSNNETRVPIIVLVGGILTNRNDEFSQNGFRYTGNSSGTGGLRLQKVISSNGWWTVSGWFRGSQSGSAISFSPDICDKIVEPRIYHSGNMEWQYFEFKTEVNNYSESIYNFVDFNNMSHNIFFFKDIMVEKGNKATAWSPNPLDTQDQITSVTTRVTNAEVKIDANTATVALKADRTVTDGLTTRMNSAEAKITPDAINLTVKGQTEGIANKASAGLLGNGKMMKDDPAFLLGANGLGPYPSLVNTTLTRIENLVATTASPIATSKGYRFIYTGPADNNPGIGPRLSFFGFATQSRANAVFVVRFIAILPVGWQITDAHNSSGTGSVNEWLTNRVGTGKYEEYVFKKTCGLTGTFSTINYFDLRKVDALTPTPTVEAPAISYVAWATCYDMSDVGYVPTNDEIKTSFTMTNNKISLMGKDIEMTGKVTFASLDSGAQGQITTANTNASNAVTTANSASTTANNADSKATTANSNASTALSTANTANTNAGNAQSAANAANINANNAVSTANTANTNASNAVLRTEIIDLGGGYKKILNPTGYSENSPTAVGAILVNSPILSAFMFTMKVTGYVYLGNGKTDIDLTITGYAYTSTSILNYNYTSNGAYTPKVYLARDSAGKLVVQLGETNTSWAYPKLAVDYCSLGHNIAPDSYKDGWTMTRVTTLPTLVGKVAPAGMNTIEVLEGTSGTVNNWKFTGKTTIDGGKIETDSITAVQIAANTITATQIAANTITGAKLVAGTLTAREINVTDVFAQNVTATGLITANNLTVTGNSKLAAWLIDSTGIRDTTGEAFIVSENNINSGKISVVIGSKINNGSNGTIGSTSMAMSIVNSRQGANFVNKGIVVDVSGSNFCTAIEVLRGGVVVNDYIVATQVTADRLGLKRQSISSGYINNNASYVQYGGSGSDIYFPAAPVQGTILTIKNYTANDFQLRCVTGNIYQMGGSAVTSQEFRRWSVKQFWSDGVGWIELFNQSG